MQLSLRETDDEFRVQVAGALRWNDRLRLSAVAAALRRTRAGMFVLDGSAALEADRGAFEGIASTARRMALVEGLRSSIVAPAAGIAS